MIRLLLLLLCTLDILRAQAPVLKRGPYLQMAAPTAMTVCWRTETVTTGRVRCGTALESLSLTFDAAEPAADHQVRLTGLTPATRYYYEVESDGELLAGGADYFFHTPPAPGAAVPVRFWVLGDPGTASIYQRQVRDAFAPLHAERRADLWLMLGDNAYGSGTDLQYQAAVFDMYPAYLRSVPLWSCLGNHETYAGFETNGKYAYENIFAFPTAGECGGTTSGTERYYSWNHGPVHFISLDSMTASRAPGQPMALWLEADLQANTQPWVVAFWHHPPYSKGSHNSDLELELVQMREYILPILEGHGVDLVLCGHSHNYERSFLLDGHYGTSNTLSLANKKGPGGGRTDGDGAYYKAGPGMTPHQGAVYVTAGSSGQTGGGTLNHPAHFIALSRLGSVVVDVDGARMDVRFLREAPVPGAAPRFDDSFTIIKGVEPPPLPQLTRGPYLQKSAPTAMTVRWRTSLPATGRVRYGAAPGVFSGTVAEPAAATDHSVRLTGLRPGARYYYQVETGGITLAGGENYYFQTPPPAGSSGTSRIWVLGDCGTASLDQQAVRDAFLPLQAQRPADLILMLGDNAYGFGTDAEYQDAVFQMYKPWLDHTPLWSCIGNHETYSDTDKPGLFAWDHIFDFPTAGECGGVASGTERYFSWDHANIHFIALDSMTSDRTAGAPMLQWLAADLAANTQQWTVVCFHHPPYTKGSHDSDFEEELIEMRENVLPILEAHGVDLVLCGHSHCYERSYLLNGHYGDSSTLTAAHLLNGGDGREGGEGIYTKVASGPGSHDGTVYVVAGSSGQTSGGTLDHPAHFISLDALGSVVLDVNGLRMDVRFLREDYTGESEPLFDDSFTLLKGAPSVPLAATGLATAPADGTSIVLHWTDNSNGRAGYAVQLSADGIHFTPAASLPPGSTGTVLTGLLHGATYQVRINAFNVAGAATSDVHSFVHDGQAPPLAPREQWRFLHWGQLTAAGERADDADPDGDTFVNLLEYAFGTSPRRAGPASPISAARTATGALSITFPRQAARDITYAVEFSATLAAGSWQTAWTSSGEGHAAGPVTVIDPASPPGMRIFGRVRVTPAVP